MKMKMKQSEIKEIIQQNLTSAQLTTEDQVKRYKVPDLYLSGMGMTRKREA